ncbi:hypothetical protein [Streptomyces sp. NPDC055632]
MCTPAEKAVAAPLLVDVLKTPGTLEPSTRTAVQPRALADEMSVGRPARLTVACQGAGAGALSGLQ